MVGCDTRPAVLDDDHGSANPPSITCDEDGAMVGVDVHANEFTESPGAAEFPEVRHEPLRVARKANYTSVDVDDIGMRTIDLRPCRQSDVWGSTHQQSAASNERRPTFNAKHKRYADDRLFVHIRGDVCH